MAGFEVACASTAYLPMPLILHLTTNSSTLKQHDTTTTTEAWPPA